MTKFIILIIVLIVISLIVSLITNKEGYNPNLNMVDSEILQSGISPFYLRDQDSRYAVGPNGQRLYPNSEELLDGGIYTPLIYEPGTNNTYGDLMWNYTSPRMKLSNNCMDCNKWGNNNVYNTPPGQSNLLSDQFSNYNGPELASNEFPINGISPLAPCPRQNAALTDQLGCQKIINNGGTCKY